MPYPIFVESSVSFDKFHRMLAKRPCVPADSSFQQIQQRMCGPTKSDIFDAAKIASDFRASQFTELSINVVMEKILMVGRTLRQAQSFYVIGVGSHFSGLPGPNSDVDLVLRCNEVDMMFGLNLDKKKQVRFLKFFNGRCRQQGVNVDKGPLFACGKVVHTVMKVEYGDYLKSDEVDLLVDHVNMYRKAYEVDLLVDHTSMYSTAYLAACRLASPEAATILKFIKLFVAYNKINKPGPGKGMCAYGYLVIAVEHLQELGYVPTITRALVQKFARTERFKLVCDNNKLLSTQLATYEQGSGHCGLGYKSHGLFTDTLSVYNTIAKEILNECPTVVERRNNMSLAEVWRQCLSHVFRRLSDSESFFVQDPVKEEMSTLVHQEFAQGKAADAFKMVCDFAYHRSSEPLSTSSSYSPIFISDSDDDEARDCGKVLRSLVTTLVLLGL